MNGDLSPTSVDSVYGQEYVACPICDSPEVAFWKNKSYQHSTKKESITFSIWRCGECKSGFLNPPPSQAYLNKIYTRSGQGLSHPVTIEEVLAAEKDFPNSIIDADRISQTCLALLQNRKQSVKVLDVGSGFGFFSKAFLEKGAAVTSLNPGQYENDIYRKMNSIEPVIDYFENFSSEERYDVVLMSQVLEHLLFPYSVVTKVNRLLAPGGVFAVAVPNFRSALVSVLGTRENGCLWVPEHVNYFSAKGLMMLGARANLPLISCENVSRFRYDAISRRVPFRSSKVFFTQILKFGQIPVNAMINRIGRGVFLNAYYQKVR